MSQPTAMAGSSVPTIRNVGLLARILRAETNAEVRKILWGYLFISPWLLGILIFVGGPILVSLALSFTQYDILSPPKFVALDNYRRAFKGDRLFWSSLGRTFYYATVMVPLGLLGSLLLAILLNQALAGTNVFRTIFFIPHLTPSVAMALLWIWLLHPELGPINAALSELGIHNFPWLSDKRTVIPSFILMSLWAGMGGNRMLIFLAGLQGVPRELEEAAEIDGAGTWNRFRHVTLPMITPTIFFNLVLGIIGALQVFAVAFVATAGGPAYGSWFFALHIYNQAFSYMRMGYGSALAWIFLLILLVLTFTNFATSKRWVFYQGGLE